MRDSISTWLSERGFSGEIATMLESLILGAAILIFAVLAYFVAKKLLVGLMNRLVSKTRTELDDVLVDNRVFDRLAHLVPAVVIYRFTPLAVGPHPFIESGVRALAMVYMAIAALGAADAILNALASAYSRMKISKRLPIKSIVQLLKVVLFFIGGVFIVSILIGQSPIVFLSGMGAFTAVLLLIFKDAILGFVAGIQITSNDMVRKGDWIEMPKYMADGDVIDVSLTTVKVQNWDKTITMLPAYALVSESFRNWRGMSESGGRRIKRSVHIDMRSVRFCDEEMIQRFKGYELLHDYVTERVKEVAEYNESIGADDNELINGRRMTNLGTFRAYLEHYLRAHPKIHQDMTLMVRQLAPGPTGLPIEIYAFSSDQKWEHYEGIMGDIFDHVLAVIPLFELRVFQQPTGADLESLASRVGAESD